MGKFQVNFNIYSSLDIVAKSKDEAEETLYDTPIEKLLDVLKEEILSGGLEVGTIEKITKKR